jgi:hypothetical protein
VIVDVPELPWGTVRFVAESVKEPPPELLDPPTFTTTEPTEPA